MTAVRVTDDTPPDQAADVVEAHTRRLMAINAGHQVRGWDTQRTRNDRLAEIDDALDEWLRLRGH